MKRVVQIVFAFVVATVFTSCDSHDEPLSLWMARSEMARVPDPINLDFQLAPKWDYSASVELMGMLKVAERYDERAMIDYVRQWADTMIDAQGRITCYDPQKYNIDHLCPGKLLLRLFDVTGDKRYMTAAGQLMEQYATHPRTSEGGLWHKKVYPHQMWLDGLYMGAPFIAEYGLRNGIDVAADMVRQFLIVGRHTYDINSHLYRHAWDESRRMFWADSTDGRSRHAWGRANGWYMMGMVDALEFIPEGTPGRDSLIMRFTSLAKTLLRYQDSETGMWYQVLDSPGREGNFIESSCSAMFIYSMLKGARLGFLPADFRSVAEQAFCRFAATFVVQKPTDVANHTLLSVTQCCAVAGLGGKDMRDGSFEYYIGEKVRDNDPKTIGPFLLACMELNI